MGIAYVSPGQIGEEFDFAAPRPRITAVAGFDAAIFVDLSKPLEPLTLDVPGPSGPRRITVALRKDVLIVTAGDDELAFDIGGLVTAARASVPKSGTAEALTLDASAGALHGRLVVESLGATIRDRTLLDLYYGSAILLIGWSGP